MEERACEKMWNVKNVGMAEGVVCAWSFLLTSTEGDQLQAFHIFAGFLPIFSPHFYAQSSAVVYPVSHFTLVLVLQ